MKNKLPPCPACGSPAERDDSITHGVEGAVRCTECTMCGLVSDWEKLWKLYAGITAVRDLINESTGVAGMHLNGELASWESLQTGGRFEEWLIEFNYAEQIANQP